jgi:signal transduction histidine kinase
VRFTNRLLLSILVPSTVACAAVVALCWVGLSTNQREERALLDLQHVVLEIGELNLREHQAVQMMLIDPPSARAWAMNHRSYSDAHRMKLREAQARTERVVFDSGIDRLARELHPRLRAAAQEVALAAEGSPEAARRAYDRAAQPAMAAYADALAGTERALDERSRRAAEARADNDRRTMMLVGSALTAGLGTVAIILTLLGRRVEAGRAAVEVLLEGMDEGLCLVDRAGQLSVDRSQSLSRILPGSERCHSLPALLARCAGADPAEVAAVLELLFADDGFFSPFEQTATLLPATTRSTLADGSARTVALRYRPRLHQGRVEAIYLVAIDVTAASQDDEASLAEREALLRLRRAADAPESFAAFAAQAEATRARTERLFAPDGDGTPADRAQVARELHTWKGTAASFGFAGFARQLHAVEEVLVCGEEDSERGRATWRRTAERWLRESREVLDLLRLGDRGEVVRVHRARLAALASAAGDGPLGALVEGLTRLPAAAVVAPLLAELRRSIESLPDKEASVEVAPQAAELSPAELEPVRGALLHLLQNAVDHGLQTGEERARAGKPPRGQIVVDCRRQRDGGLEWSVTDDGRGIDTERLADKMVRAGRWSEAVRARKSRAALLELVFEQGLSSRDTATLSAGRGVGTAAARQAVEAGGGALEVQSEEGSWTRFTLTMPPLVGEPAEHPRAADPAPLRLQPAKRRGRTSAPAAPGPVA